MVKLTDVAELAGVSPTTVSRVINNYGYLSQKTIDKVHAAMKQLNYQPNNLARSLQGKSTKIIGLIFPSIQNPFYAELIEYLEEKLFNKDYKVILCNSQNNPQKERYYLQMLAANQVDAVISGSHNLDIKEYNNLNLPIVSFDRLLSPNIPIVSSDNFQGGVLAAKHLLNMEKRKLALISGTSNSGSPTDLRKKGFSQVLNDLGISFEHLELSSNLSSNQKKSKIKNFISSFDLDGVFCTDDLTAIITKDFTDADVVGYDATKLIQNLYPYLTSIVQPIEEIADVLIDTCFHLINKKPVEKEIILPVKLQVGF